MKVPVGSILVLFFDYCAGLPIKEHYILARVGMSDYLLVSLNNGNRWEDDPIHCEDGVTVSDLEKHLGVNDDNSDCIAYKILDPLTKITVDLEEIERGM